MSILEEAIVIADQYLTEEHAFNARMAYTRKASEFGYYDKMFVSFSWCWSKFVKDPERYSSYSMLWQLKWVVENLRKDAIYSIAQLEQLFALFKEYLQKYRYSLRPYYEAYMHLALITGRREEADEYYKLWRSAKRDSIANCQACEQHAMGVYYFSKGHYRRGLQLLKPILEGKLSCVEVPGDTYELIIPAYLALRQVEDARRYADKAYRALKNTRKFYQLGTLIAYYTVENRRRALQIFRDTCRNIHTYINDWDKLHYLIGVQFLLEQAGAGHKRKRKTYPGELEYEWVCAEIDRLMKAFDERNRNQYVSQRVESLRKQYAEMMRILA